MQRKHSQAHFQLFLVRKEAAVRECKSYASLYYSYRPLANRIWKHSHFAQGAHKDEGESWITTPGSPNRNSILRDQCGPSFELYRKLRERQVLLKMPFTLMNIYIGYMEQN